MPLKVLKDRSLEVLKDDHLSKWLNIPDGVYLDKMHLCDIGTFKSIFNSFFDAKKKQEDYYLGQ